MPIYRYTAYTHKGKEEKGMIDADDPIRARRSLKAKGLYVKLLEEDREKKERELFPFLSGLLYRVSRRQIALFARQLGTLIAAGIPLDRSLANIIEQTDNVSLKKALIEMKSDVIEGSSLSDSIKKHSAIFPPVYYNLISVGEKTGAYEETLLRLADLEDANIAMKNRVVSAMAYPIIIITFLAFIMIFLISTVVPQIERLYLQMDQELPLITRMVIGISHIMTTWYYVLIIIATIALLIYIFRKWKHTVKGRIYLEELWLRQPLFGTLVKKVLLARFARNLGVMLQNGVALIVALQVVSKAVNHLIFEKEITDAIEKIKQGSRMTDAFRESIVMTQMVLGMLSAGEMTDRVPEMVDRIATILEEDADTTLQRLSVMIEPALMILVGFAIVMIMLAILLPMYNLAGKI